MTVTAALRGDVMPANQEVREPGAGFEVALIAPAPS